MYANAYMCTWIQWCYSLLFSPLPPPSPPPCQILPMEEADHLCTRIGIMNFGHLRCLGTQSRLKSKFGTGYQLAFNCAPGCVSDVEQFVRNNLRKLCTLKYIRRYIVGYSLVLRPFPTFKNLIIACPAFLRVTWDEAGYGIIFNWRCFASTWCISYTSLVPSLFITRGKRVWWNAYSVLVPYVRDVLWHSTMNLIKSDGAITVYLHKVFEKHLP